jgi:hypothetical protein
MSNGALRWVRIGLDEIAWNYLKSSGNISKKVRELAYEKYLMELALKDKSLNGLAIRRRGRPSKIQPIIINGIIPCERT